jgi:dTDP-glucose 4,6-dehydratase
MNARFVVIGSNSFSGAYFVDYLLQEGLEVIGISRSPEPDPVFLPYKKRKNSSFRFYQMDLNNDLGEIIEGIKNIKPDYVVNFAAQGMVAESWLHPEHWFQTNVVANVRLHDQLRRCDFLKKYIHISTPEVYGPHEGIIKENTIYAPSTPYAVSRAAADMSLMSFYRAYRFPVAFTRSANVYGPGQQLYRIVPRTILFALLGKKLKLHGGGRSVRSFIHIRDVVSGTLRVALKGKLGEIYHFSTDKNISIRSLVKLILKQMGESFEDHVEDTEDRLGKDTAYLLDCTKAEKELGWDDQISLEQGVEETIAWVRDNLDAIKNEPFDYIHKP